MIKLDKKGGGFLPFDWATILFVILMLGWLFVFVILKTGTVRLTFGEPPQAVLQSYYDGEKTLFYIDQSVRYAAYKTIFELGEKGGFDADSECGDYFGYSLWADETRECYPFVEDSFKSFFNGKLNSYLVSYPDSTIPLNNYYYSLEETELVGTARRDIEIPIYKGKRESIKDMGALPDVPKPTPSTIHEQRFRVTHYIIAHENDYVQWYSGAPIKDFDKDGKAGDGMDYCILCDLVNSEKVDELCKFYDTNLCDSIKKDKNKLKSLCSVYEESKCQGTVEVIEDDGTTKYCRYNKIKTTKAASLPDCWTLEYAKKRGLTAGGTYPNVGRTIAVDKKVIPLGSKVYIDWGDGNSGCFVAEDVGGGVKGNHIDHFTGVGKSSLNKFASLPMYAMVTVVESCPIKTPTTSAIRDITGKVTAETPTAVPETPIAIPEMPISEAPTAVPQVKVPLPEPPIPKQIVGWYSIEPSFRLDIGYDISDFYGKTIEQAKKIISICSNVEDRKERITKELSDFNSNSEKIKLSLGSCETGAKQLIEEFYERYVNCLKLEEEDCICSFDMAGYDLSGDYKIKITKEGILTVENLNEGVQYTRRIDAATYSGNNPSEKEEREYIDYFLTYSGDGFTGKLGIADFARDTKWDNYDTVNLYKPSEDEVVFVKETAGKMECADTIGTFRFCAESNQELMHYEHKSIAYKKPLIKFALRFIDLPPPPLELLNLQTKKKSDGAAVLLWDESETPDAVSYNIYVSENDFSDKPIIDGKINDGAQEIEPLKLEVTKSNTDILDIDLSQEPFCFRGAGYCDFFYTVKKKSVTGLITELPYQLEDGVLYYLQEQNQYLYILGGLKNGAKYFVAVVAEDRGGNVIDNQKEGQRLTIGKNYGAVTVEDDLAPGAVEIKDINEVTKEGKKFISLELQKPTINIDKSPLPAPADIHHYTIYFSDNEDIIYDDLLSAWKFTSDDLIEDLESRLLKDDTDYYFYATATDNNGNEHTETIVSLPKEFKK